MFKVLLGLFILNCGWAVSSPVPRFGKSVSNEIQTDSAPGDIKRQLFDEDFRHPEEFHHEQQLFQEDRQLGPDDRQLIRDPNFGNQESVFRAINNPLFFDTFDHGKMMSQYAERRQREDGGIAPFRFRSIRPDFPFSDLFRRKTN